MKEHKIATESKREDPYPSLFEVKGVSIIIVLELRENLIREFDKLLQKGNLVMSQKQGSTEQM